MNIARENAEFKNAFHRAMKSLVATKRLRTEPMFKCDDFAYSLASMLDANQDDEQICEWLRGAKVGDEFLAGGAAGAIRIVRLA